MIQLLYVLAGVAVGAVAVFAWMNGRLRSARKDMALVRHENETLTTRLADATARMSERQSNYLDAQEQLLDVKTKESRAREERDKAQRDLAAAEARLGMLAVTMEQTQQQLTQAEADNKRLHGMVETQKKELELKEQRLQEADSHLRQQMEQMQERMVNVTNQLLKARAEELEEGNRKQMNSVTAPLTDRLEALQRMVQTARENNARDTESVRVQIQQMMQRSKEMSDETTRLANALTHRSKFQGNLGESVLQNILENAGLREGRDYELQQFIRTETGRIITDEHSGRRMQPDVILHFPDKKDAIIDSKVSLTAYTQYVNAESEQERQVALSAHVQSVRRHVEELARKDYSQYIEQPKSSFDFVIMFLPFEGAFQTAMNADPELWSWAFDRRVCIAGELNITVILRMIKLSWTQFQQTKNQQELYRAADDLVKRIGLFYERMDTVRRTFQTSNAKLDEAMKSLEGRLSITSAAKKIVNLGAKDDHRIPDAADEPQLGLG